MIKPIRLSDNGITLEALTMAHAPDLSEACKDGTLWETVYTFVPNPQKMAEYINKANETADRMAFAVIDEMTGKAIGSTSFYNIMPEVKRLEIGYTWYAKSYWRSRVNTTCKLMLMTHAFEALNYQTIGLRTDIINSQSQRAIERLGLKRDGVIRGDRIRQDGTITDSVVYSMTVNEWPDAKDNLSNKLKRYEQK
ncbi:GNAT family N-acetyltransferase [Psychrobacter sanguinis]|uniref:GNAT family N-acetyltransferase n=1 Tax=Psychrobacter sanguinis TaxID=861445 RepID=UPI001D0F9D6A|nr:GNAT family N-acetyltransferase [Psychrobacter sanguinis]MCC3345531.1 GNAT family N-acetyltransferase [Psychrobacter sanguinis]